MLAWTIYLSFAGALLEALLPKGKAGVARWLALCVAVLGLFCAVGGFVQGMGQGRSVIVDVPWVPSMGIHYLLAADGISRVLVLLTGLAAVAGILFSWNVEHRTNEFFAFYLALIGGVYGVFLSFDFFLLFVFYEIAIVPKYFLIAIWGSTRREYGAMKLALYSFVGSAMVLIGLLAAYSTSGSHSTSLIALAHAGLPVSFQMWCFPLVFIGFAILAGMWPFHTWAPTGHVAAPTAASMLLAGVVLHPASALVHALEWRPLAFVGTISYGVYLLHIVVLDATHRIFARWHVDSPYAAFIVCTLASVGLAALSYRVFERPLLRLKDRWRAIP